MGIFGNKQEDNSSVQSTTDLQATSAPIAKAASMDNVTVNDPIASTPSQSIPVSDSFMSQTAPTLDNSTLDKSNEFIMTDPPATTTTVKVEEPVEVKAEAELSPPAPTTIVNEPNSDENASEPNASTRVATDSVESFYKSLDTSARTNSVEPEPVEEPEEKPEPEPEPIDNSVAKTVPVSTGDKDLDSIKKDAIQQLSPIVNLLDQSPEEKFHTAMMMMQATDNQDLVKTAYEAAQSITDEKTKAQALLDIVNEINFFTQEKK